MQRGSQMAKSRLVALTAVLTGIIALGLTSQVQSPPLNPKVVGAPLIEIPGHAGGELREASTDLLRGLNPYVNLPNDLTHLIHATLVELNPLTLKIEPALAESFAISEDNKQLMFTLRQGVHWSDGELLTVDDVAFTFVDLLQNEALLKSLRDLGVEITPPAFQFTKQGERTVRLDFSAPIVDQALADMAAIALVLPRHKLADTVKKLNPNATPDAFANAWGLNTPPDQIVGTGPFRLKEIRKTGIPFVNEKVTAIVLERNPFYWKVDTAGTPLPYVDRFTRIFVEKSSDSLTKSKNGEIDLIKVGSGDAVALAGQPGLQLIVDGPVLGLTLLSFNQNIEDPDMKALFRDVRFRQAVAYAIDRTAFLKGIPEREPFLAARESFVHPLSPFFSEAATARFAFSLDKAKALLDAIGLRDSNGDGVREFANGKAVAFELITNDNNPIRVAAGKPFVENLRQVGIRVDFKPISFDEIVRRLDIEGKKPDYQAVMIGFGIDESLLTPAYLQPFFASQGASHIQRFSDAQGKDLSETQRRIDEIFNIVLNQGATPDKQGELLLELQQILSQDLSLIPLWSERAITVVKAGVKNAQNINLFGLSSFLEVLWKE